MITFVKLFDDDDESNVELYCCKNNKPTKFNLFIGENGSGKTYLLEKIYEFLNQKQFNSVAMFVVINNNNYHSTKDSISIENIITVDYDGKFSTYEKGANKNLGLFLIEAFEKNGLHDNYWSVWRKLIGSPNYYVNYKTDYVSAETIYNKNLDIKNKDKEYVFSPEKLESKLHDLYEKDKEFEDDADSDSFRYMKEINQNMNQLLGGLFTIGYNNKTKKISIDITKKDERHIPSGDLSQLSSGELRALSLAMNMILFNYGDCQASFIDEPETNMHPRAQLNFADFFNNNKQNKEGQVFIATHSPFVVQSFLQKYPNDTSIFHFRKEKKENRSIYKVENLTSIFNGDRQINLAEINYRVFGIPSIEYLDLLIEQVNNDLSDKNIIILNENNKESNSFFSKLNEPHSSNGYCHKSKICFVRNYYHHHDQSCDEYLQNENIKIEELLKETIDECLTFIAKNKIN